MQENKNETIELLKITINTGVLSLDSEYWINQFYQYKSQNPSVKKSNKGGYQSESNIHYLKEFFPLVKIINNLFFGFIEDPNIKLTELWFNINPPGTFNRIHDHGPFITKTTLELSGAIYLKTPPNSGDIIFYNPLNSNDFHSFFPSLNRYFLFPRWLKHSVDVNLSQEDRISIAFNFS
jgi:hypothetical protein